MVEDTSLNLVRSMIEERQPDLAGKADTLPAATALADIGLDSLAVVELLFALAADFDVDLETAFEGLDPPRTLGDLANITHSFAKGS